MLIVGLDICKSSVVACVISELPPEPRQFYYDADYQTFDANAAGIRELLELKPNVAVMEPTGVNYQKLWGIHLHRAGVKVVLVGHAELHHHRAKYLKLPDKDDQADALALACYYLTYQHEANRFLPMRDEKIIKIREIVLRLHHLNRIQSPVINRIRQDLAWQFPEVALVNSRRCSHKVPLLWGWLAGERESTRYERLFLDSIGLGISDNVVANAQRICHLQREEMALEDELDSMMRDLSFELYHRVFEEFGFGQRIEALILSQIYPIENFLGEGNRPIVTIKKGRNSGKPTKRHLSRRRFEKALGVAPTENSSGDKKGKKVIGGSRLCRTALWQWTFTRVEPKRNRNTPILIELGEFVDEQKAHGKPIKLIRSHVGAKTAKMLFKKLVKSLE